MPQHHSRERSPQQPAQFTEGINGSISCTQPTVAFVEALDITARQAWLERRMLEGMSLAALLALLSAASFGLVPYVQKQGAGHERRADRIQGQHGGSRGHWPAVRTALLELADVPGPWSLDLRDHRRVLPFPLHAVAIRGNSSGWSIHYLGTGELHAFFCHHSGDHSVR